MIITNGTRYNLTIVKLLALLDTDQGLQPLFAVDLARKDAKHALNLAEASGTKMKDMEVADGHLADVQKHMGSKGDIAGIYGAVRQEAGLKFENQ